MIWKSFDMMFDGKDFPLILLFTMEVSLFGFSKSCKVINLTLTEVIESQIIIKHELVDVA